MTKQKILLHSATLLTILKFNSLKHNKVKVGPSEWQITTFAQTKNEEEVSKQVRKFEHSYKLPK